MKNILLTIAGIIFLSGAYHLVFTKTYVIYLAHPRPYYPIEVKGIASYLHFASMASLVNTRKKDTLKGAIVTLESGPIEKGKIECGCPNSSLTFGYFPFKSNANNYRYLTLIFVVIGSWLLRTSFKENKKVGTL